MQKEFVVGGRIGGSLFEVLGLVVEIQNKEKKLRK